MDGIQTQIGTTYMTWDYPGNAAADASAYVGTFVSPFRCKVTGIDYTPAAAITGTDTNYHSLEVQLADESTILGHVDFALTNAGTGTVAANPAAAATTLPIPLATAAKTDGTAVTAPTAAHLTLASGDVLALKKIKTGTGLLLPAGRIRVALQGF